MSNELKTLLFTDKYKPQTYSDLLTEEKTNREILTWMKSWDEIVFNRKFTIPKIPIIQNINNQNKNYLNKSKKIVNSNSQNLNEKNNINQIEYYEVEYVQSKHKIILISGPPGIGKTTMANIISRQCGYEPIIINSSDERTADKLITRIYDTTLMHNLNVNKSKPKPTCLILDEIDGISSDYQGKNSIKSIIDFIKNGRLNKGILGRNKKEVLSDLDKNINYGNNINFIKFNKRKNDNKENNFSDDDLSFEDKEKNEDENYENNNVKTKKNKQKNYSIKRPIICICNDLYAKQLILLRKEAFVINIKKADEKKVFDKMVFISKKEKLPIDRSVIKSICELTKYDIRACLNALQFISFNKDNFDLTMEITSDIDKLKFICNKDFNENLFNIWNKIIYSSGDVIPLSYNYIRNLYNSSGEYNKIIEGLFSNYLKIQNKNSLEDIEKRSELTELFSYEDYLSKKGINTIPGDIHNYTCMSGNYINHYYFSTKYERNLIEFPSLFFELKQQKKINDSIIETLQDNLIECGYKNRLSKYIIVTQIIPYVYRLIQPKFKEINFDLMTQNEKEKINNAVNIMILIGISLKNNNNSDNEEINFEPNIGKLLEFDNIQKRDKLTLNQKLILKNQYEKIKSLKNLDRDDYLKGSAKKIESDENKKENYINNFSNFISSIGLGKKRKSNQINRNESKFIYKFHEGVTDCVKRPLNINYFLGEKY